MDEVDAVVNDVVVDEDSFDGFLHGVEVVAADDALHSWCVGVAVESAGDHVCFVFGAEVSHG